MIIVCSPTKTLAKKTPLPTSDPVFINEAKQIINHLRLLDINTLKSLYHASDSIVNNAKTMIDSWSDHGKLTSIYAFTGLQFKNLDINSLEGNALEYALSHIKIASGLYGLLNATDAIDYYRYDLENKLDGLDVANMYIPLVSNYLNQLNEPILDLTSSEYSVLLQDCNRVKVIFLEDGSNKGTINKMYRGKLMRYCALHQIDTLEKVKEFNQDGFIFDQELSNQQQLVFTRRKNND